MMFFALHRRSIVNVVQQQSRYQSTNEILVERLHDGLVTKLILNRPKANAMGSSLLKQFAQEIQQLASPNTSNVRCVILSSSSPRVFSAGADLKERAQMTVTEAELFVSDLRDTFEAFSKLPMPTISAVEGVAVGGGMELAIAADLIVASKSATFGLPETSLGIIPGAGGTQRIPRIVTEGRAKEWIFTGRKFTAREAYDNGLVQRLVEPGEANEAAFNLALEICNNAPIAIRAAKEAIQRGIEAPTVEQGLKVERECYSRTLGTKDRLEGLAAFREGRSPVYKGE